MRKLSGARTPAQFERVEGLITDALDDRLLPGEGDLPVHELARLFADSVPLSIEVRSKALRDAFPDPVDRARHTLRVTQQALDTGGHLPAIRSRGE